MTDNGLDLRAVKSFPSLVKYLRDELDWPIESDDVEDLTFDYDPEELGLDAKTAVKIKEIKQLRPLASSRGESSLSTSSLSSCPSSRCGGFFALSSLRSARQEVELNKKRGSSTTCCSFLLTASHRSEPSPWRTFLRTRNLGTCRLFECLGGMRRTQYCILKTLSRR